MFSNRIVGYSIDSRMKSRLATAALHSAVARRGKWLAASRTPIADLSSGQGDSFTRLAAMRFSDRWAALGRPGDHATMESFFSLLQKNVLDRRRWGTREELRIAIVTWIERT